MIETTASASNEVRDISKNFKLVVVLAIFYRQRVTKGSTKGNFALLNHVLGRHIDRRDYASACRLAALAIAKTMPRLAQTPMPPKDPDQRQAWLGEQKRVFGEFVALPKHASKKHRRYKKNHESRAVL